ncbi:LysR substrate-binding domain-containing protein [Variovorax paradoxus]|uniref:LysR substrate-binding domain-containing protein n=1 Tax=Variovorax paradoxus TaxID=34073 RepID=UPI001933E1F0|nr:LysR family transcriptional regulator [Variovorax paradoxus]
MELRQLRYFAAIAAERSFTKAAEKLHISQPPLSQQMSNLEQELGVRLLVRTSRSVELSEAGRVFLPHVLTVLERLEEGRAQLARVARGLEGRVTVGLTGSHFLGPLPRFIQAFRQQRPRVEVVLLEMAPVDQFTALGDRGIDLCFSRGIPDTPVFASDLLWRDTPVVVLPPGHPLAGREGLRLAELRDEDFVFFRLGSSLFVDAIHGACIFARFEPRIVQQVVEVSAVLNLVAAGLGVSVVPGSIAAQRAESVAICPLVEEPQAPRISADVFLVRRKDEERAAVLALADALRDWAARR